MNTLHSYQHLNSLRKFCFAFHSVILRRIKYVLNYETSTYVEVSGSDGGLTGEDSSRRVLRGGQREGRALATRLSNLDLISFKKLGKSGQGSAEVVLSEGRCTTTLLGKSI